LANRGSGLIAPLGINLDRFVVVTYMKFRRLVFILATLVLAATSLAQFTSEQKEVVLSDMDKVLKQEAFVPGVDLGSWRTFLDKRKERLEDAETPNEFALVVNSALREFGLSHIVLMRDRTRRWGAGEESLTAQRGRGYGFRGPALRWLEDDAALIRVPTFEASYDEDAVTDLFREAKSAKYLVLDLRGNPGGEVERMRQFLGLVLPADSPVGTFVSRRIATEYAKAKGKDTDPVSMAAWAKREFRPRRSEVEPFRGEIAVLVDGGSASAAEIVANALKESRQSPIIGSPTAGAVLVSTYGRLSYGFRIQFPVGDYVSHGGRRLEGHPIRPDVASDASNAVDAALAKLRGDVRRAGAIRLVSGIGFAY
jgi:hypothetical protein